MQKKTNEEQAPAAKPHFEDMIKEWMSSSFISNHGKKIGIAVILIAIAASIFLFQGKSSKKKTYDRNKELGPAYVYFSRNQLDSAAEFLKNFVSSPHQQLVRSKAYLLLGNAQFSLRQYDEALESYRMVEVSPVKQSLIASGALHGIAACYMQIREYQKAAESLEKFITTYKKRAENPEARILENSPEDLSPSVPNVLWKLALCYKQLDAKDKVKKTCDTLIRVYAETEEAGKAKRLLMTI